MRDIKIMHKTSRHKNAGKENSGHENASKTILGLRKKVVIRMDSVVRI